MNCRMMMNNHDGTCYHCKSIYAAYADLPREDWLPLATRELRAKYKKGSP
jgi:hypothetical protein